MDTGAKPGTLQSLSSYRGERGKLDGERGAGWVPGSDRVTKQSLKGCSSQAVQRICTIFFFGGGGDVDYTNLVTYYHPLLVLRLLHLVQMCVQICLLGLDLSQGKECLQNTPTMCQVWWAIWKILHLSCFCPWMSHGNSVDLDENATGILWTKMPQVFFW